MKFIELPQKLKQNVASLYVLKGEDSFVVSSAIKHISNACGNEMADFNKTFFDNENFSANKLIEAVEMMPLGNDRKFVLIKGVEKISENEKKTLQSLFENLPLSTTVVLVYNDAWKFLKNGEIVDCGKQSADLLQKFVRVELNKRNTTISPEALKEIVEICNFDMTKISNEIKKVASFANGEVEVDDIKLLIEPDNEYKIFELTEALGSKNSTKSILLLSSLLSKKEPIPVLFGLISNHFRRLAHCAISPLPNNELAEMFGVKEFAIAKAKEQAKYFSKSQLRNILEILKEIDFMIKSGKMSSENAIYYLVFKILYC